VLYFPTLAGWQSAFGKSWFLNWERHLEFSEDLPIGPQGAEKPIIVWRMSAAHGIPFREEDLYEDGGFWYALFTRNNLGVDDAAVGASQYVFQEPSDETAVALCGSSAEDFWELHIVGPDDHEFYYPYEAESATSGKLRAVKDRFGHTVCVDYDESGRLERIRTWSPTSGFEPAYWDFNHEVSGCTGCIDIEYRGPGNTGAGTPDLKSTVNVDTDDNLTYWISPEHQGVGHTEDFTYGTSDPNVHRILSKEGLDRVDVEYSYASNSTAYNGYLTKVTHDPSGSPTAYTYTYAWDDEDSASPPVWKSGKKITRTEAAGESTTSYLMSTGDTWKRVEHGAGSSDTLTSVNAFLWDFPGGGLAHSPDVPGHRGRQLRRRHSLPSLSRHDC
jgi:YD repeat-containing protein